WPSPSFSSLFPYTTLFRSQLAEFSREERVAAIQFPAISAPVQHLVLQPVPPFHCFGIVVINKPAFSFPPFHLIAAPREIAPRPRDRKSTRLNSSHDQNSYA